MTSYKRIQSTKEQQVTEVRDLHETDMMEIIMDQRRKTLLTMDVDSKRLFSLINVFRMGERF